ncbi:MAG: UDP-2,3-diacylglucosamine diphosphatase [Pirellulaceae bacterium]|nr:UDP-2,3-diacylglucosamine diphosphatase [Pirellulaceae bacterium]
MTVSHGGLTRTTRQRVRSVFISDTHLGCRYSQAEPLLAFLSEIEPDYLYLVGDILDGWRLARRWHWRPVFSKVLARLIALGQRGTQLRYAAGNHDAFLRDFLHDFGFLEIADEFVHYTADERRLLVLHGDRFDDVEIRAQWLSVVGAIAYDSLMWTNSLVNRLRGLAGLGPCQFAGYVKRRVKRAVTFVSRFEERLAQHARQRHCDGVVCGHVHTPMVAERSGLAYFNTGDWVENRTALVELRDGRLELWHLPASDTEFRRVPLVTPTSVPTSVEPSQESAPASELLVEA